MKVSLFGKEIGIKEYGCAHGSTPPQPIPPSVNLFVKVTDGCNARCPFCSNASNKYHGCHSDKTFDHGKLWQIVDELIAKGIIVNRLNITGGEPSIVPSIVNRIIEHASADKYRHLHLHLNTNGLLPSSQTLMRHPRWNSISVSLHHYDVTRLSQIYGTDIPGEALSFEGIDMDKVNASCNLIKDYIDSAPEVEKMLKFAVSLGLTRIGFVSLMRINDYCRNHYVDFDEIDFPTVPHLYFTESRNRGLDCKCSNYLYNHNCKILEVYMRNYANPDYCESSLIYDRNHLRHGFNDDSIIF